MKAKDRDDPAARRAAYIKRTVDCAPPLTQHQRATLARLLNGGAR